VSFFISQPFGDVNDIICNCDTVNTKGKFEGV
jgi:hypothetical protein